RRTRSPASSRGERGCRAPRSGSTARTTRDRSASEQESAALRPGSTALRFVRPVVLEALSFELARALADQVLREASERRVRVVAHQIGIAQLVEHWLGIGDAFAGARLDALSAMEPGHQIGLRHVARCTPDQIFIAAAPVRCDTLLLELRTAARDVRE